MILDNFVHWLVASTLFSEMMNHHNTRIGPVLEVTTSYMYGKHGIEIRIWSVSQDNSQSWVRISYGTNKYVVDSNYNNTEVLADLPEEQASQSSVKVIAVRSMAKAKAQKREKLLNYRALFQRMKESGLILNQRIPLSLRTRSLSKKVINLLRHNQTVQRQDDGAVQFWRIKIVLPFFFHKFLVGRMIVGKFAWQQEEDQKEDISIALIFQEQFFTSVLFKDTQDVISLVLCCKTM